LLKDKKEDEIALLFQSIATLQEENKNWLMQSKDWDLEKVEIITKHKTILM